MRPYIMIITSAHLVLYVPKSRRKTSIIITDNYISTCIMTTYSASVKQINRLLVPAGPFGFGLVSLMHNTTPGIHTSLPRHLWYVLSIIFC